MIQLLKLGLASGRKAVATLLDTPTAQVDESHFSKPSCVSARTYGHGKRSVNTRFNGAISHTGRTSDTMTTLQAIERQQEGRAGEVDDGVKDVDHSNGTNPIARPAPRPYRVMFLPLGRGLRKEPRCGRKLVRLSVSHRPQDRFASLSRLAAAVRVTRPTVERDASGANLHSPKPSSIVRTAAHAIDAGRGQPVDHERPIILGDINRAVDPREGRPTPFEARRAAARLKHVRSAR